MTANIDFDEPFEEETEEEAPPKKRSPLRIVLLVLIILVLLCVVCYGASQLLGGALANLIPAQLQGMLPAGVAEVPTLAPVIETETPTPATTEELPLPGTGELTPTQEPAPPATEEVPGPTQPTQEPTPTVEQPLPPTEQPAPTTEQPVEATPTTAPVPGPTSTPTVAPPGEATPEVGPTVVITPTGCDNNVPPVAKANGPYTAMMGKGLAFVNFSAAGSTDPDGTITNYTWEFGDGSAPAVGENVTYGYKNTGNYVAILTVTDNCNATGQDTAEVTIVGPTPPANGTPTPANSTPTPTPATPPNETLGFCYLVQYGDTLTGIAWYYGISVTDLATVNGVSPDYYVLAGQGLFIPMGPITNGPNTYQAQAGDTLYGLAYQCGLTPAALAEANNLDVNATLSPGQVVIIPLGK